MTRNPALSDHAARAASCKTRWYYLDLDSRRRPHKPLCICQPCQDRRKAFVRGWLACREAAAKKPAKKKGTRRATT